MRRPHHWKQLLRSLLLIPLLQGLTPGCGPSDEPVPPATPPATQRAPLNNIPAPVQVVLEAEADTYVWSTVPGTNYGTATSLMVDKGAQETYLRFNLSSIPAGSHIASVQLQMLAYSGAAPGGDGSVYTYLVPDDSWSETGMTWNNRPAVTGDPLGSWWMWYGSTKPLQVGVNYSPRLKTPVQQALDSDGLISFRLNSPGYQTVYRSREYATASERPKLIVSYFEPSVVLPTAIKAAELNPVADAQVLASNPSTNYGKSMGLTVDRDQAETYLRFSLASVPADATVVSAVLVTTSNDGYAYDGGVDGSVYTHLVPDDTWSETGITWNNKPAVSGDDLGSWWLWNRTGQYTTQFGINSSPKLVEPVQQALNSDGLISLRLMSPGYKTVYWSREYTNTSASFPKLLVYYVLPPPPPCPVPSGPAPAQVVLEPEADTYVWSSLPGTNYGTAQNLVVDKGVEETYLRFNLSSIPAGAHIASVQLQTLAYSGAAPGGDGSVYTYLVPDDSWSETGMTWYNRPASSGTALGSWWMWYGSAKPLQVGVNSSPQLTAPVQQALDSDGRISFRLSSPSYQTVYYSREYPVADRRPKLIVSYFAPSVVLSSPLQGVELYPVADAQVLASNPGTNYGAQMSMALDRDQAEAYLRFNLASLPADAQVASVVLVATSNDGYAYEGEEDGNVYTHMVSDDTWSETGITWNNKPTSEICDLGTWSLWNRNGQYATQVGINASPRLVDPVQQALGTDGLISFRLRSPGWKTVYWSREYANSSAGFPKLLVFYTLPAANP